MLRDPLKIPYDLLTMMMSIIERKLEPGREGFRFGLCLTISLPDWHFNGVVLGLC